MNPGHEGRGRPPLMSALADDRGRPVDHRGRLARRACSCRAPWARGRARGRPAGAGAAPACPGRGRRRRSASGCCRSRFRWHSGHGVTRQSASASIGVAQVAAGLLERGLLVHRDDREAAALAHAGVVDHGAAERLDHLVQVAVARVLGVDPEAVARAHDVAAVERPDARFVSGRLTARAARRARSPRPAATGSSCWSGPCS